MSAIPKTRKRWCLNGGCFMHRKIVEASKTHCLVCDQEMSVVGASGDSLGDLFDSFFGGQS